MDQRDVNKLIRIAKKLFPKVLRWWKKRQQQQQQGGSGGGAPSGASYATHASSAPGQWQGGYNNQQFPANSGPPTYPMQQAYSPYSQGPSGGYMSQPMPPQHGGGGGHHVNTDMINASNPQYTALRNAAIREGDLMHQCFDGASKAHNAGDGARAKELSNEGHAHQAEQRRLNAQASAMIYSLNNAGHNASEIDLHGLYVQEAIQQTEQAIQRAQQAGLPQLIVITGKGLHSTAHVAKIKPAIEDLMNKYNLSAHVDPHNPGRLIVNLRGGGQTSGSRDLGFVDQLDQQAPQGSCAIM